MRAGKTPAEIIGSNDEVIKKLLVGWAKVRERLSWNEYVEKINPETRDMVAEVFAELRRNGFYNCRVREDKIIVDYVCYGKDEKHQETLNLCTLCERECSRKNWKGVFNVDHQGNEVTKCWE